MVGACPIQWLFFPEKGRRVHTWNVFDTVFIFMFLKSIFKLKNIKYFLIIFIFLRLRIKIIFFNIFLNKKLFWKIYNIFLKTRLNTTLIFVFLK
jgi:hypothetical protein